MLGTKLFADYQVGETYQANGRTVTHSDIRMWIGATDGSHPNHVNREYCRDHPVIDDIVAPGLLTLSLADAFCAQEVSKDAAYGLNYGHDDVRYLNPVYIGDTISGVIEVDDREVRNKTWGLLTLDVLLVNQDSQEVLVENHKMLISRVADV